MHVRSLVAFLILAGAASSAAAQTRTVGLTDVHHTLKARKLLMDDPELAPFNIGVVVTNRVAVLWGPAPSAEIAFRAELCMRTMVELTSVRNELFISDLTEPVRSPLKIDVPPLRLPDMTPPKLPRESRPIFGAPGKLLVQEKADTKKPAVTTSKSAPIQVLPPEALSPPPLPGQGSTEVDRELTQAIRTLLQSKTTYQPVQFAVQDRRVFLKAADSDTLHEAARAIAKLPNVAGVIVLDKGSSR